MNKMCWVWQTHKHTLEREGAGLVSDDRLLECLWTIITDGCMSQWHTVWHKHGGVRWWMMGMKDTSFASVWGTRAKIIGFENFHKTQKAVYTELSSSSLTHDRFIFPVRECDRRKFSQKKKPQPQQSSLSFHPAWVTQFKSFFWICDWLPASFPRFALSAKIKANIACICWFSTCSPEKHHQEYPLKWVVRDFNPFWI